LGMIRAMRGVTGGSSGGVRSVTRVLAGTPGGTSNYDSILGQIGTAVNERSGANDRPPASECG
jgi:hypothetical protein